MKTHEQTKPRSRWQQVVRRFIKFWLTIHIFKKREPNHNVSPYFSLQRYAGLFGFATQGFAILQYGQRVKRSIFLWLSDSYYVTLCGMQHYPGLVKKWIIYFWNSSRIARKCSIQYVIKVDCIQVINTFGWVSCGESVLRRMDGLWLCGGILPHIMIAIGLLCMCVWFCV